MTKREWQKKPALVACIWWTDSAIHADEVTDPKDASLGLVQGFSAGVVVKVTDEYITLAHDRWQDGHFRGGQSICRKNIDKVKWIKVQG